MAIERDQHANCWANELPAECLLTPVPEIFCAARLLSNAAEAHLAGDRKLAEALIRQADLSAIAEWTEKLWGNTSPEIHRYRPVPGAPATLPVSQRVGSKTPTAEDKHARHLVETAA